MISVQLVNEHKWSENLADFNPGCLLNSEWLESISDTDKEPVYINFVENGGIIAKTAGLVFYPNVAAKKHLYFYSGPALKEENATMAGRVVEVLVVFAQQNRHNRVVIRSYDSALIFPKRISKFRVSSRHEYIVNLGGTREELVQRFSKSARKKAGQAQKNFNLTLKEANTDSFIEKLIDLMEETRKIRLSKGYANYNYYYIPFVNKEVLYKLFHKRRARIFYIENSDGEINCIRFVLASKPRAFSLYIGTNAAGYTQRMPNFMNYELAMKLFAEGYSQIGLGGVQSDASRGNLAVFKKSVGGVLVERTGGSTNYLIWPRKLLNPILVFARILPEINMLSRLKKKYL